MNYLLKLLSARVAGKTSLGTAVSPPKFAGRNGPVAILFISLGGLLGLAGSTSGQTHWTDGTGDWFLSTNWSAGIPNLITDGHINNGGTAQIAGPGAKANNLFLADSDSQTGNLTVSGTGNLQCGASLAVANGGTANMTIDAGGSVTSATGSLGRPVVSAPPRWMGPVPSGRPIR